MQTKKRIRESLNKILRKAIPIFRHKESNAQNSSNNYNPCNIKSQPCHYNYLFIQNNGSVFPCCEIWSRPDMKIGHITDPDLFDKIDSFYHPCTCDRFSLRKGTAEDKKKYSLLNIEMSLACQAKCAMCCVDAPGSPDNYSYYDELTKLVDYCKPDELMVQGGEILVQKKSIEWLESIRAKYPNLHISMVSNGNVDLSMLEIIEKLFNRITFSIVGFQPETYKKIMGIDQQKTFILIRELLKNKKVAIALKYLITPTNLHEADLFLDWAIEECPYRIIISDANTKGYINSNTSDNYWNKIISRTEKNFKKTLITKKQQIQDNNSIVVIEGGVRKLFDLNNDFIIENNLEMITA